MSEKYLYSRKSWQLRVKLVFARVFIRRFLATCAEICQVSSVKRVRDKGHFLLFLLFFFFEYSSGLSGSGGMLGAVEDCRVDRRGRRASTMSSAKDRRLGRVPVGRGVDDGVAGGRGGVAAAGAGDASGVWKPWKSEVAESSESE